MNLRNAAAIAVAVKLNPCTSLHKKPSMVVRSAHMKLVTFCTNPATNTLAQSIARAIGLSGASAQISVVQTENNPRIGLSQKRHNSVALNVAIKTK